MRKKLTPVALVAMTVGVLLGTQLSAQQSTDDPFADNPFSSQSSASSAAASQPSAASQLVVAKRGSSKVVPSKRTAIEIAEAKIDAILDSPLRTPLRYEVTELDMVVEALIDEYQLPIIFDRSALDEVAISPETNVSISVSGITLRSALRLLLMEPGLEDLTFIVRDEVLLVTTEEKANESLEVRVYRVDDLRAANQPQQPMGASAWADYERIVDILVSCVEHDSWMENGTGGGEIRMVQPGMLVVTQTYEVHRQIRKLLADLRGAHAEIQKTKPTVESRY